MSTPKAKTAEGKRARGQGPNGLKGCCCKRSQCIKNYCDCYQSMAICSKLCRCVGCRNTEVRKVVDTSAGSKNSSATKREKANAMSAKAAAAAAKAGINVPMKGLQAGGSGAGIAGKPVAAIPFGVVASQQPIPVPINISAPRPLATGTTPSSVTKPPVDSVPAPPIIPVRQDERRERNLFVQPVNAAVLECLLIQATEAEQMGLNELQVGQLVLAEFVRSYKGILEKICEYNRDYF
ncbi:uncharacterized protein LOC128263457 isoform X1 [Drosophila gunungcola]|uniref:CRC domain-containing protein n=2 Tax=Drosophila gunungcola TaxID=103775 RepID=A0A9Q0BTB1_9MUSC|nr:uncharacterized protein LOC128263457 isoform X1 [Drosophila gunungcola]KAI8043039.1 hypothetical protein M5D96_004364 [Drosophila gunungcola]